MEVTREFAQAAYDAGQLERCAAICIQALQHHTTDYQFAFLLASCLRRTGDLVSARRVLLKGYLKFPRVSKFLTGLSEVEYAMGNRKAALDAIQEAATLNSSDLRLLSQLCRCYAFAGNAQKAKELLVDLERRTDFTITQASELREKIAVSELWQVPDTEVVELGETRPPIIATFSGTKLPLSDLATLRALTETNQFFQGTIIGRDGPLADSSVRNASVSTVSAIHKADVYRLTYAAVRRILADYANQVYPDGPLQLVRYEGTRNGHYHWHKDTGSGRFAFRSMTVSLGISCRGRYLGGELQIQVDGETKAFKLDTGDGVIFQSGLTHRVKPVTEGTRFVIVGWFSRIA